MRFSFALPVREIRRRRPALLVAAAAVSSLVIFQRVSFASELFSESVAVPARPDLVGTAVDNWKGFGILFRAGDQLPPQDATDTFTDPFAVNGTSTITDAPYSFQPGTIGQWVGPGPVSIGGLQRLQYTGTTAITTTSIPDQKIDNPAGEVQFGVVGPTDNSVMHIVSQHWTAVASRPPVVAFGYERSMPVVSVTPHPAPPANPPAGQSFKYIIDFLQFTQNGMNGTEWVEFPYLPGQQPTFTYDGWADPIDRIHFTNVEQQLSDTLIPLDDLNYLEDPPTNTIGAAGFTSEALPADVVPEPTSLLLVAAGLLGLLCRRSNHRQ